MTTTTDAAIGAIWFLDNLARIRVSGDETEGRLALVEASARRGHMPPLHVHHEEDETFVLLAGEITLYVGDRRIRLADTGASALAPKGIPHTFRVESETADWLVAATPSGFDRFVASVGVPAEEAVIPSEPILPDPAALAETAAEFGIELLGPPGALPS
jgi:quercetin dioxygenase-like cupin family protein